MNILIVNLPYAGHTNPTLPLTRELVARGHHVTYVNAESFRDKIVETGAVFVSYRNYPAAPSEQQKKRLCFRAAYETAMALEGPFDLLIYEMFFYPGIDIAKKKGIPCVRQFSQSAWSEQTWVSTPALFKISSKLIDVQVLRKKDAISLGLSHVCLKDGIINSRPDLNIVYVPKAFQPKPESFDDTYLFTVPAPQSGKANVSIDYAGMKKPIVYISLGSIISDQSFYKACIRAFGNKEFSVILNTGKILPESLGKIPSNIYAYSFVPQIEVLQHTDVFLTHCGMNSINEALCLGVPMVAMPFLNDQLTNAARLVELGLAKRVRSFPSSGKEIYEAVRAVYESAEIRKNVDRMQAQLCNQSEWDTVVRRIETLTE